MSFEQQPRVEREPIQDPEIVEILNNVDFKGLRAIFEEHASRSGIEPRKIGFIERDRIFESDLRKVLFGAIATHTPKEQVIDISSKIVRAKAFLNQDIDKTAIVLSLLCHEEAHASSHESHESHEEDVLMGLLRKKIEVVNSGIRTTELASVGFLNADSHSTFTWFNEGITDELAATVYGEYLRRHPTEPHEVENGMEYVQGYPLSRIFVRTLRDRLAEEAGVPPDVVWGALVRAYMQGDDFSKGELRVVLDEVFSENFITQLSNIGESSNILNDVPIVKSAYGVGNVGLLFARVISPTIAKNMLARLGIELRAHVQRITNKIARE